MGTRGPTPPAHCRTPDQAPLIMEVERVDDQVPPLLSESAIDVSASDLLLWGSVDLRRRNMTDDKAKQLVDRNRLFLELQQLTIDEYKIKQRILQEGERAETLGEGEEFAKLRRQMATEKDVKKVARDLLVLQESGAHAVACLLARNNERLIALLSEKLDKGR